LDLSVILLKDIAAVAYATPDTSAGATALICISGFFIGWNESVCLSNSGIELLDQREIGTAVGGEHAFTSKMTPSLTNSSRWIHSFSDFFC
jgi:hypothetical protein